MFSGGTRETLSGQTQGTGPETEEGQKEKERKEIMKIKNWLTSLFGTVAGVPQIIEGFLQAHQLDTGDHWCSDPVSGPHGEGL